jgi:hypothetical protein
VECGVEADGVVAAVGNGGANGVEGPDGFGPEAGREGVTMAIVEFDPMEGLGFAGGEIMLGPARQSGVDKDRLR